MLEKDSTTLAQIAAYSNIEKIRIQSETEIHKLEKEYKEKSDTIITDAKYGFISGALNETFENGGILRKGKVAIDDILTHKYLGFPVFILFMWLMFQTTFSLGSYPMGLIGSGVSWIGDTVRNSMSEGPLRDLLVDGIIGGVGGVIVFLPNILILFFFISFMEDSGYMARASFIMDKLMHKIGLHGKSFIPMLMGFGCNVPAIMATRTLENKKDRLLTMMIIPFMSCSARLPIYVLLISAIFHKSQGLILVSIYLIGIIIAIHCSAGNEKIIFRKTGCAFCNGTPTLPHYQL